MCTFGPNLGMPFPDSLGQGLFEIRAPGKEGIGRAFFCTLVERKILILHAYIKKSQKTPIRELEFARKRQAEVQRRGGKWER
jgi:phage-related protein